MNDPSPKIQYTPDKHLNPARIKLNRNFLLKSNNEGPPHTQSTQKQQQPFQESPIRRVHIDAGLDFLTPPEDKESTHYRQRPTLDIIKQSTGDSARKQQKHNRSQSISRMQNQKLTKQILQICFQNNKLVYKILGKSQSITKMNTTLTCLLQQKNRQAELLNQSYRKSLKPTPKQHEPERKSYFNKMERSKDERSYSSTRPRLPDECECGQKGLMESIKSRLQRVREELYSMEIDIGGVARKSVGQEGTFVRN